MRVAYALVLLTLALAGCSSPMAGTAQPARDVPWKWRTTVEIAPQYVNIFLYAQDVCVGSGPLAAVREGAILTVKDSDGVSILGSSQIDAGYLDAAQACVFPVTVDIERRSSEYIVSLQGSPEAVVSHENTEDRGFALTLGFDR
ncbi:hypothetical protein HQ308_14750 [Rhodococcus sp. BP-241]|uniref:hypothetical protein n=1 Tax=Rhodococcus sp. BP-241 TaxID=2739441 RepID=UPI001C9A7A45|nr:hypothetical protein [Rhodococcus sp. BP-241]MBY6708062.1 hypothetical protein [Rhodococcus sp. BP-241]